MRQLLDRDGSSWLTFGELLRGGLGREVLLRGLLELVRVPHGLLVRSVRVFVLLQVPGVSIGQDLRLIVPLELVIRWLDVVHRLQRNLLELVPVVVLLSRALDDLAQIPVPAGLVTQGYANALGFLNVEGLGVNPDLLRFG